MSALPWILILLAWPVTPLVVSRLKRPLDDVEPEGETQLVAKVGAMVQLVLLVVGFALLVPRWL